MRGIKENYVILVSARSADNHFLILGMQVYWAGRWFCTHSYVKHLKFWQQIVQLAQLPVVVTEFTMIFAMSRHFAINASCRETEEVAWAVTTFQTILSYNLPTTMWERIWERWWREAQCTALLVQLSAQCKIRNGYSRWKGMLIFISIAQERSQSLCCSLVLSVNPGWMLCE